MARDAIKGITIEFRGDTTDLGKALSTVNKEIKSTDNALKEVDKALKLDPSNVELLAQREKLLNDEIAKTEEKLSLQKRAAEEAARALEAGTITQADYARLAAQVVTTEKSLEGLKEQANGASNSLDDAGDNAKKAGDEVKKSGDNANNSSENWEKFGEVAKKACEVAAAAIAAVLMADKDALWGDVYLQLSNFEEDGGFMTGAKTGAFEIDPVCAIVADVDHATTPDTKKQDTVALDGGVSIMTTPITDKRLRELLRREADRAEIKHQLSISTGGTGTNTTVINLVGCGIPTVDIGLPLRNMHTCSELISMNDAESMRDLIALFITSPEIEKEVMGND